MDEGKKTIVIVSLTSDIGVALAQRYAQEGHRIIGTYRTKKHLELLKHIPDPQLFYCDLEDRGSVDRFLNGYRKLNAPWDVFISLPCTPLPLRSFFQSQFDEWSRSIHINAIEQLGVLHGLYPMRNATKQCDVVFLAGGGVNNAVLNFSAYTVSKIMLIKMCEFLDAENEDLNVFIVGPGLTKTKTHHMTLEHLDPHDKKYARLSEFMKTGVGGTSMDDIYGCVTWLCGQGKAVASGRNFSVVNDQWKGEARERLASALKSDSSMYKLRRHRNGFLVGEHGG